MNPFLLGLFGSLAPLGEAAAEVKGAFSAVGGDIAQMRAIKKTTRAAKRFAKSKALKRAKKFLFGPTRQSKRNPKGLFPKIARGISNAGTKALAPFPGAKAAFNRFLQPPAPRPRNLSAAVASMRGSSASLAAPPVERASESSVGQLNYSRMIADMANPNAYQNEQQRSQREGEESEKADKIAKAKKEREEAEKKVIKGLLFFGGALGTAASAVTSFLPAMNKFAEIVTESNRELAPFSGEIASSFARLDIAAFFNQLKTAKGVAGSTGALNDAVIAFRDTMQPLNQDFRTVSNLISLGLVKLATQFANLVERLNELSGLHDTLAFFERWLRGRPQDDPTGQLLQILKDGELTRPRARPLGKLP